MVIAPLLFSGFTQTTITMAAGNLMAATIKDFFINLFLHPGQNFIPVVVICAIPVAACVGGVFLIKKIYDKYCPEHLETDKSSQYITAQKA